MQSPPRWRQALLRQWLSQISNTYKVSAPNLVVLALLAMACLVGIYGFIDAAFLRRP
jgi:hypothetical protein